jgi:ATP adenylyltransferase
MDTLWAPWRIKYILGKKSNTCIFCIQKSRNYKKAHLILHESSHSIVIINKYPYSPGHLMVSPKRHIKDFEGLIKDELSDLIEQVRKSTAALKHALNPHGFNIGANLGKVAGAGIEDHLHIHVVPRWNGDTNFMPVIGKSLIISEYLENTYKRLLPRFKKSSR